ncbi:hypothetical protein [Kyrpidia sp.]|uniref:hypothetical protein n=1 Tax=Kyrpidia sp. TaxID=2073077 RepID=UPI002589C53B|nr:hypothetical protein [Kyrpidia sp.]MCL6577263.1 hypothetical protein [Kyrpidia sp.]
MWRQARNPSWIWLAVAGAVLLASPQGRKAVARWARTAAEWLEGMEHGGKTRGLGGSQHSRGEKGHSSRESELQSGRPKADGRQGSRLNPGARGVEKRGLSKESKFEQTRGDGERATGSRDEETAEGQVVWWVTKPAGTGDERES